MWAQAGGGDPFGIPSWAQTGIAISVLMAFAVLWIRGSIVTAGDRRDAVAAAKEAAEATLKVTIEAHHQEVMQLNDAHADTLTALNLAHDNRVRLLTQRLDGVLADRDAWREAHADEAAARRAAETATRHLMESSNVSLGLLAALKDALAQSPPTRPHT